MGHSGRCRPGALFWGITQCYHDGFGADGLRANERHLPHERWKVDKTLHLTDRTETLNPTDVNQPVVRNAMCFSQLATRHEIRIGLLINQEAFVVLVQYLNLEHYPNEHSKTVPCDPGTVDTQLVCAAMSDARHCAKRHESPVACGGEHHTTLPAQ